MAGSILRGDVALPSDGFRANAASVLERLGVSPDAATAYAGAPSPTTQLAGWAMPQISPLADAMMQQFRPALPTSAAPGLVPLATMLLMQQGGGASPIDQILNGADNLRGGYRWNGMPEKTQLDTLSAQAAGNVAGTVPGGGTVGNGVY
jgi:hypothetical protein